MVNYLKLSFFVLFFLFCSNLFAQNINNASNDQQILNELKKDGIVNDSMLNKLSSEQITDIIKSKIEAPKELLERELDYYEDSGIPRFLTPIVAIICSIFSFVTIFFIVFTPLFINYKKDIMLYRTINNMVEKNIEIPSELIIPQPKIKKRISNLQKGIILLSTGIGISSFLLILEGISGGNWAIGLIPLFIGFGYLLIWIIEDKKYK
jgi:hypothetical protein